MNNFTYSIPTKVHFGKGQIAHLDELKDSGNKVLLVYGGGSIKRAGIYDRALEILQEAGLTVLELSGVEPNPRIESVRKGVEICKKEKIDMILSIGGGSVIDCGKVIAAGACSEEDPWELVLHPEKIKAALPLYCVLTLAATGSEMDGAAVISDLEKQEKWVTASEYMKPVMAVMDPEYTFSVSRKQTAAGTADIISHIFENYFTNVKAADVQARFAEGLLKTCFHYGPVALKNPEDYDARANLMWASSMAINGLIQYGAEVAWCVHPMEHELSAFYDITHGEGLAILTPHWMEFALNENTADKFADYGRNVWGIQAEDNMEISREAIRRTKEFFKEMGLPATLTEVGINRTYFDIMAEKAEAGCQGSFVELKKEDIISIFENAL
ncbi:MAG TPA: iron-containing alcohol dehydrogenase [Candidatus Anaerostipes excrementavium]|uniref:Iron-containing alcohol dehydrogenase n=1 Tax=Candidatus Anaerostipes excrementavium TaxID=2838463 RepID=A0A9D1WX93_9FIRM|nr:iron-containing alcohol dehydrogenase [uncultured Anaerostipes sp.]HIX68505.1 iron-containing alcohol dehydrogenase [Candidatus Anaerostipes excrementavium]